LAAAGLKNHFKARGKNGRRLEEKANSKGERSQSCTASKKKKESRQSKNILTTAGNHATRQVLEKKPTKEGRGLRT